MSLRIGTRLGAYEIVSAIGAGGMGEVYRARDTKLDRDVAIKVLPETFAKDPDRIARFQREAKTLASLNHPHIAWGQGDEAAFERLPIEETAEALGVSVRTIKRDWTMAKLWLVRELKRAGIRD